ncbi:MAG TPA: hypothetical protein VJS15_05495 [Allosphingosinicella sp.]|nr:hypothetical protein [Allosphingosinicella sp.]
MLGIGDCAAPPEARPRPLHHAAHGPPPRSGEEWARALDAYEAAEAEVEEAEASPADYEDEHGERLDALCGALRQLLRTPAPDLYALALKVELTIAHGLGPSTGGAACLAAIRGDARRLAAAYPGF